MSAHPVIPITGHIQNAPNMRRRWMGGCAPGATGWRVSGSFEADGTGMLLPALASGAPLSATKAGADTELLAKAACAQE